MNKNILFTLLLFNCFILPGHKKITKDFNLYKTNGTVRKCDVTCFSDQCIGNLKKHLSEKFNFEIDKIVFWNFTESSGWELVNDNDLIVNIEYMAVRVNE